MKKLVLTLVPLIVLGSLVAWRFSTKAATEAALQQGGPGGGGGGARGASPVEVTEAAPLVLIDTLESVGTLESPYRVQVSPKTTGRIEYLQVREGDRVKPGQLLVKLDPSELQAAVYQQEAAVAAAKSRLAEAQLGRGPTEVGVSSQIAQQKAAVSSAQAQVNQVRENYDAQVASAQADVDDAAARVNSARANIKNAEAELARQRANLANARTRLTRLENIYKQGFIAAQDVDDARTEVTMQEASVNVAIQQVAVAESSLKSAQAQKSSADQQLSIAKRRGDADLQAARAQLAQAQASLEVAQANKAQNPAFAQNIAALRSNVKAAEAQLRQARARLADATLYSPIEGTVTARAADPGNLASPGQPVITVQYLDWLYVSTSVPIHKAAGIREGQPAEVTFESFPNRKFRGEVTNINPAADVQTRQYGIKIRLENPQRELKPGMFGRVAFELNRVNAAVAVPREAVKQGPDGPTVAVVDAEGVATVREVKTGAENSSHIQIISGVQPGDKVVILSYQPIRDGQKVTLPGQSQEKDPAEAPAAVRQAGTEQDPIAEEPTVKPTAD